MVLVKEGEMSPNKGQIVKWNKNLRTGTEGYFRLALKNNVAFQSGSNLNVAAALLS